MEASKVTFFRETQARMSSPVLDAKKKRKLKIERVKEYVRSKPAGTKFQYVDLIYAAGYNAAQEKQYNAGYAFIKGLDAKGIIKIEKTNKYRKEVTIPSDANAQTPLKKIVNQLPKPENTRVISITEIEQKARNLSWHNPDKHNDLRAFIATLR